MKIRESFKFEIQTDISATKNDIDKHKNCL